MSGVVRRCNILFLPVTLAVLSMMGGKCSVWGLENGEEKRLSPDGRSDQQSSENDLIDEVIDCPDHSARIIGGHDVAEGEYPFVVALVRRSGKGTQFCGGALLTASHVLTAAHCFFGLSYKASWVKLVAGTLDPHDFFGRSPHEQTRWAKGVYTHPNFSDAYTNIVSLVTAEKLEIPSIPWRVAHEPYLMFDFAVLEAEEPFVLGGMYVKTIPLPHFNDSLEWLDSQTVGGNVICTVAGWGTIKPKSARIEDKVIGMRQTHLKLLPHDYCESKFNNDTDEYGQLYEPLYDRTLQLCAMEDNTDACQGDSGGPFFCKFGVNQQPKYVGVVSWGHGCAAPGSPGIFARLDAGESWIRTLTKAGEGGSSKPPASKWLTLVIIFSHLLLYCCWSFC